MTTSVHMQFRFGPLSHESDLIIILGDQSASVPNQTTLFRDDFGMDNTSHQMAVSSSNGYGTLHVPDHELGTRRYWGPGSILRPESYPGKREALRTTTISVAKDCLLLTEQAVVVANAQTV